MRSGGKQGTSKVNIRLTRSRVGAPCAAALLAFALALLAPAALAQTLELPTPAAAYADQDPAGAAYPEIHPASPDLEATLNQGVRRGRNNPVPLAQRGLYYTLHGQRSRGQRDYDRALTSGEEGSAERRYAHWSYGWALHASGDHAGALAQWRIAADLHGGHPHWVPSTYAIALWSLGARESAVAFFDVAVRDNPALWQTGEAVEATTQDWRPNDRLTLLSIHNLWQSAR